MKYLAIAVLLAATAQAETAPPCTGFKWPMAREVAAAAAAGDNLTPSGTKTQAWPDGAVRLALAPGSEAAFPVPPQRAPKPDTTAGYLVLHAPASPGVYQVSLSGKAWIDVVQDGKTLPSGAHTSDSACPVLHKSVRFEISAAPVILQISGSDATSIVLTIMPAAD